MSQNNRNKSKKAKYRQRPFRAPRPLGLSGGDIGMFYKNRNLKDKEKDEKINLNIAKYVLLDFDKNYEFITKIAKEQNIKLKPYLHTINMSDVEPNINVEEKYNVVSMDSEKLDGKKNDLEYSDLKESVPGPSIKSEFPSPLPGPSIKSEFPSPLPGPSIKSEFPSPLPGPSIKSEFPLPLPGPSIKSEFPPPLLGPSIKSEFPSPLPGPSIKSEFPSPLPGPSKKSEFTSPLPGPSIKSEFPSPLPGPSKKSEFTSPLPGPSIKSEFPSPLPGPSKKSEFPSPLPGPSKKSEFPSPLPGPSKKSEFPSPLPGPSKKSEFPSSEASKIHFNLNNNYKYTYEDIITESFQQKLDECLQKGITINRKSSEMEELNTALYEEYKAMLNRKRYKEMLKFREILPAYIKSKDIIKVIDENQVVVISGETGCGKSTQVPQIILDDAICNGRGANVKIVVTQPRRIAASSLAMRVSKERDNTIGSTVGYSVRLEKVAERQRGSIQFCTTGILLAYLEMEQGLTDFSHIILDEVHERDSHVDLAMCMLKQVLKKRKDLKLILMSATLDADSLSAYFDGAPVKHIEGLAYPVTDVFLEEILRLTRYELQADNQPKGPLPKWMKYKNRPLYERMQKDILYRTEIHGWLQSQRSNLNSYVYKTLQDSRIEDLNLDLILELLLYICNGPPGAILVFLPGIGDITKLIRMMEESRCFPRHSYEIYPLHSKLATLEQHKIFERPPARIRKIIIATNVAETSITIDDIVYVVDCAKIKLSGFNVEDNTSTLCTEWVSKANLHQRRGRAGRCQPGVCYHLLTTYRAENLQDRLLPELQRSNLLEPLLAIKRLRLGRAEDAFNMVPSPPAAPVVAWAINHLQKCGALDTNEILTPLGWHLARLPVHPAAGKLLILGALFGCLDRAASVAAVWGFKDPFLIVIGKEQDVDRAKRSLTLGEPSDHVAVSEAIIRWEQCDGRERFSFAYDHFLSNNTLEMLSDMKVQLGDNLKQMGFLSTGNVKSSWENRNSNNMSLFKALVAASLYPNVATVRWLGQNNPNKTRIIAYSPEGGKMSIHPSSIMSPPKNKSRGDSNICYSPGAKWLVYWLKQKSSEVFLFDVTLIYTLPLLFFGEFNIDYDDCKPGYCMISISTVKVYCLKDTATRLLQCRGLLDQVLASKVASSRSSVNEHLENHVLDAAVHLLTAESEQVEACDCEHSEDESISQSDSDSFDKNIFC